MLPIIIIYPIMNVLCYLYIENKKLKQEIEFMKSDFNRENRRAIREEIANMSNGDYINLHNYTVTNKDNFN